MMNIYAIRQNCYKRIIKINDNISLLNKEKEEQKDKIKHLNKLLLESGNKL